MICILLQFFKNLRKAKRRQSVSRTLVCITQRKLCVMIQTPISQEHTGHFLFPVCFKKKKGEGIILQTLLSNLLSSLTHLRTYGYVSRSVNTDVTHVLSFFVVVFIMRINSLLLIILEDLRVSQHTRVLILITNSFVSKPLTFL